MESKFVLSHFCTQIYTLKILNLRVQISNSQKHDKLDYFKVCISHILGDVILTKTPNAKMKHHYTCSNNMATLNSFPMLFFSLKLHLVKYWLLQLYSYIKQKHYNKS